MGLWSPLARAEAAEALFPHAAAAEGEEGEEKCLEAAGYPALASSQQCRCNKHAEGRVD